MADEDLVQEPLLLHFHRGVVLGYNERSGEPVTVAAGDEIDIIAALRGVRLTGFSSPEAFAFELCFNQPASPKAVLLNLEDKGRIVKKGPIRYGVR